jgi:hypothetical protein
MGGNRLRGSMSIGNKNALHRDRERLARPRTLPHSVESSDICSEMYDCTRS